MTPGMKQPDGIFDLHNNNIHVHIVLTLNHALIVNSFIHSYCNIIN